MQFPVRHTAVAMAAMAVAVGGMVVESVGASGSADPFDAPSMKDYPNRKTTNQRTRRKRARWRNEKATSGKR